MRILLLCLGLATCVIWTTGQQTVGKETFRSDIADHFQGTDVVKFTFGTATSVTRTGYVKVTSKDIFTSEKNYGFQSAEGLLEYDRGGSEIVLPKDEYTASVYGAFRTTSDITCALVEGTKDNAFIVTLPDGDYSVWLIASDAAWDPPIFEVWANDQKKLDVRIPRARFVFMESFQARATDGRLRIDFRGPFRRAGSPRGSACLGFRRRCGNLRDSRVR